MNLASIGTCLLVIALTNDIPFPHKFTFWHLMKRIADMTSDLVGIDLFWIDEKSSDWTDDDEEFPLMTYLFYVCGTILLLIIQKWLKRREKSVGCQEDLAESSVRNPDEFNCRVLAPLHVAMSLGQTKTARKLVEYGASVNCATTYRRNTALHYAANVGNGGWFARWWTGVTVKPYPDMSVELVAITELLLDKGADPNLKNRGGSSPLHVAAVSPDGASMLRLLLERGAHVDLRNVEAQTALFFAAINHVDACIRELLIGGANVHDEFVVRVARHLKHNAKELKEHWIKLYAAYLPVFGNWDAKKVVASCGPFYQRCLMEAETLQETFVDGNLSLYEWLRMCPDGRCHHIDNVQLKILIDSPELEERFPYYFVLILGSYHEAVVRQSLMKPAKEAWFAIKESHSPDNICIGRTFDQLTNADILDLINNHKNQSTLTVSDRSISSFAARLFSVIRMIME